MGESEKQKTLFAGITDLWFGGCSFGTWHCLSASGSSLVGDSHCRVLFGGCRGNISEA
jgi:hypothetical protein